MVAEGNHDHGSEEHKHDHGSEEQNHDHGSEEHNHEHSFAEHNHNHDDHDHDHDHGAGDVGWLSHWPLLSALLILVIMQVLELGFQIHLPILISLPIYLVAYLLAGYNVLNLAFRKAIRLDFFNEFFLMSVATLGAFAIGSYSEGVAVMVFYSIGEWFQDAAVDKAKRSIKALLDIRPDSVTVIRDGKTINIAPSEVNLDEIIEVKPGEKVALDGILSSALATFNTAALTGESKPDSKSKGDVVYAGMINLQQLAQVQVKSLFKDSKLSKILEMVQDATARKSQTQLFLSRFAKIYTPIVFLLAVLVIAIPFFFVADYSFRDWLYRGLVFLVISCPCALVVSIPLGYFGGIGLASKNGILFKGSNFLDVMTKVNTVVMDKTGTLTKGVFQVQMVISKGYSEEELIRYTAALESKSTHPIATAVLSYAKEKGLDSNEEVKD
ncbi:MAG: HAD family hydrolase, partial [Pedobacter sp.]